MAGALADFSRRPLQYKVLVFAGAGVLLGLLYWQFALKSLIEERDAATADLQAQKDEQAKLRAQKRRYDELVAAEAKLRADIEQNQKALPTEAEMPAFLDTLSRKTAEAGIELLKREVKKDVEFTIGGAPPARPGAPPAPATGSTFIKVPVDLEVVGTYYQLKKFMASLRPRRSTAPVDPDAVAEKDRIVTIETFTVSDPKVKNNEIVLIGRITASTFRAQAPPPSATPPPAAPRPAPAAAPPAGAPAGATGPATAAPPSPAELKERTERALDQAETRARGATEQADKTLLPPGAGSGTAAGGVDRVKGGL
ncbi:MAG: type 4a pilus biogenesis protein PilO [Myxococcales bacterium]|nr:type 4a pilus biogenesis protein PilO [Myxococcales bacterium]